VVHRALGSFEKNVDRFITPSRFYLEKFVEWGFDRAKFSYIPNYVDAESFAPRFAPGSAFVYFGRLSREKGLDTLIRASSRAEVPLCLIGTGPDEAALRSLAVETGADVEFLGFLTGDALHDRVAAARATVLPSEWYENAPVSALESYALGTPLIGANIGGIGELIREEETGATFTSGSVEELAATLTRFALMTNDTVEAMGRAGRAWVETEFTADRYVQRMVELYSELGVPDEESSVRH